ncbi:MAG TPA: CRISPR system precrRNA processing endoribonuclease RAMP protein Cas6 [Devosia sp.]|nr:CRISPR system precrRNA processing endoribonuclease RAMP protein Cas6 [Devosia sp.]
MIRLNSVPPPNRGQKVSEGVGKVARTARPHLPVLRLELAFRFNGKARLPPFRGSLWRSVLGPALRRLDEARAWPDAGEEGLPDRLYEWAFETPAAVCLLTPEAGARPHPLVIDAPSEANWKTIATDTLMRIQVSLIGRFALALRPVVEAFRSAAENGLGKEIEQTGQRGSAELLAVHQVWRAPPEGPRPLWNTEHGWLEPDVQPVEVPAPETGPVRVELVSPLRVQRAGRLVRPQDFCAADLFLPLIRRTGALMAAHSGVRLEADFASLKKLALNQSISNSRLTWHEAKRWSSSQGEEIPSGGIVGSFDMDLSAVPDLMEFLWIGQWINVGKGTFMGLGGIRLYPLQP